jgi:hypothetical protein
MAHIHCGRWVKDRQKIVLGMKITSSLHWHWAPRSAAAPFLRDVEVHIRFLVAIPLLIGAELVVQKRVRLKDEF